MYGGLLVILLFSGAVHGMVADCVPKSGKRVTVDGRDGLELTGFHPILTKRPRISSGRKRGAWIDLAKTIQNPTETFDVDVKDGKLTLEFSVTGGGKSCWAVNALTIKKISNGTVEEQPLHAFDFGSSKSPVEAGYTRVTHESTTGSYRWADSKGLKIDDGYWRGKDLRDRDMVQGTQPKAFEVDVKNGRYQVAVTMVNFRAPLENMAIKAEGELVREQISRRKFSSDEQEYRVLLRSLKPYLERHIKDPDFYMSRMPMNWGSGKRYTKFFIYSGEEKVEAQFDSPHQPPIPVVLGMGSIDSRKLSGDAPVPTLRIGENKLYTTDGFSVPKVTALPLEQLPPYQEGFLSQVQRESDGELIYLPLAGSAVLDYLNSMVNPAYNAALLYHLTGEDAYGQFACDVLMQFAMAVYFQDPVSGYCLSYLNASYHHEAGMRYPQIYDLCIDYLKKHEHHYLSGDFYPHRAGEVDKKRLAAALEGRRVTDVVDTALYRFSGRTFQYLINNNIGVWCASVMVNYPLAIEDDLLRARAMDGLIYSDGWINGRGIEPIWKTVDRMISEEGLWKESPSYASIAANRFLGYINRLKSVGGYDILKDSHKALRREMGRMRFAFPNFVSPGYGDSNHSVPHAPAKVIEWYNLAKKEQVSDSELELHRHAVKWLIDNGLTEPLSSEEMELLPESPQPLMTRTDYLDYCDLYLQRNGLFDQNDAVMSTLYGWKKYSHSQKEGMNFELYAKGHKVVAHNGYGGFGSKLHRYNCSIGCKNTVVPGGKGFHRWEEMNGYTLYAMEPKPRKKGVSPSMSFIEVDHSYRFSGRQRRNMALIRSSEDSGFWVDIFRSSDPKSNEYRLHCIDDKVKVYDGSTPMSMVDDPGHRDAKLGDHWLEDRKMSSGRLAGNLNINFPVQNNDVDLDFNVYMAGRSDYKVFTNTGPCRECGPRSFAKRRSAGAFVALEGEAWKRPFVSVFEVVDKGQSNIRSITRLSDGVFTAVGIEEVSGKYLVMSAESPDQKNQCDGFTLQGTFAVVKKTESATELYLGKGISFGTDTIRITSATGEEISASLRIDGKDVAIQTTGDCKVLYNGKTHQIRKTPGY